MTMYWNLKTLLGCYHANDGHNWRLLPEVKWEESVVPEINHDSGSQSGKELSLAGGWVSNSIRNERTERQLCLRRNPNLKTSNLSTFKFQPKKTLSSA